jgi:NAD-dependent dihydropyrimidine dehydrogenase PreA subunit
MKKKVYMFPNPQTPNQSVKIDPGLCTRCLQCVEVCRSDVLVPHPDKREPPIVLYPDECWFCGCCVEHCPVTGAIKMIHPLNQRLSWKRKDTGDLFRVGMRNPPPPNKKPPVG